MSKETVILFPTNAHVMRAEKLVKDAGLTCKLIPVPRELSSDCGVCLSVNQELINEISSLFEKHKLAYDDIVHQV